MRVRLGFTEAELKAKVDTGEFQSHTFPLGFVITEIKEFEGERLLIVHLLGGKRFDEWACACVDHLLQFGRDNNCNAMEALCRKGLEPILKPLGWKRHRVLLRAKI